MTRERMPDGSTVERDATGRIIATYVDDATWAAWEAERLERIEQARSPREPQPSRRQVLEADNAALRAEVHQVHRLRDLADAFAVMLSAQAEPCPCFAVPPALEVAA